VPHYSDARERLRELVSSQESESLEHKRDVLPARQLASAIAALANANGGTLVLGVDERRGAVGVEDVDAAHRELEKTARMLNPAPPVTWEDVTFDGKPLVVVDVGRGDKGPYITPDGVFLRQGSGGRRLPFTPDELAQAFQGIEAGEPRERALEHALAEMNKRLAELQEQATDGFDAAERDRHWTAQLPGWIAGSAIGAVFGAAVTLLLGS